MKNSSLRLAVALALGVVSAYGQIVTYSFDGSVSTPTSIAGNASAGNFGATGVTYTAASNAGRGTTGWETTSTLDTSSDAYFSFTVTPDSGFQFNLTTLTFNITTPAAGSFTAGVNAKFAVAIGTSESGISLSGNTVPQVAIGNASGDRTATFTVGALTAATEFRVYVYDVGAGGASPRVFIDSVSLNGSVTPVPEPSHIAFAAGLGLLGFSLFRRCRK